VAPLLPEVTMVLTNGGNNGNRTHSATATRR
jgi:hypothetical protein